MNGPTVFPFQFSFTPLHGMHLKRYAEFLLSVANDDLKTNFKITHDDNVVSLKSVDDIDQDHVKEGTQAHEEIANEELDIPEEEATNVSDKTPKKKVGRPKKELPAEIVHEVDVGEIRAKVSQFLTNHVPQAKQEKALEVMSEGIAQIVGNPDWQEEGFAKFKRNTEKNKKIRNDIWAYLLDLEENGLELDE